MSIVIKNMSTQIRFKQNGFTLIEVLVSLVIVAIGLLGLAGMQIHGMQGNNGALMRTQASFIANDFATRMRVNKIAIDNNVYALANYAGNCAAQAAPNCISATCTSNQIATMDIADFICDAENTLQNVRNSTVSCADNDTTDANPCTKGSPHTISLSWVERTVAPNTDSLADSNLVSTMSLVVIP